MPEINTEATPETVAEDTAVSEASEILDAEVTPDVEAETVAPTEVEEPDTI